LKYILRIFFRNLQIQVAWLCSRLDNLRDFRRRLLYDLFAYLTFPSQKWKILYFFGFWKSKKLWKNRWISKFQFWKIQFSKISILNFGFKFGIEFLSWNLDWKFELNLSWILNWIFELNFKVEFLFKTINCLLKFLN